MFRRIILGAALSLIAAGSAQALSGACTGYHPSVGYFNKCTPQGRALYDRLTYGDGPRYRRGAPPGSNDPCLGYHPSVGYFNKCTPRGRALYERLTYGN